jgi:hypothetical protein
LIRGPKFIELDGRRIDTASREWLVICLARWICRLPGKVERHAFLDTLKWSGEQINELKQVINTEWERMYPKQQKQGAAANDNA